MPAAVLHPQQHAGIPAVSLSGDPSVPGHFLYLRPAFRIPGAAWQNTCYGFTGHRNARRQGISQRNNFYGLRNCLRPVPCRLIGRAYPCIQPFPAQACPIVGIPPLQAGMPSVEQLPLPVQPVQPVRRFVVPSAQGFVMIGREPVHAHVPVAGFI